MKTPLSQPGWQFWIDRGGTFTDIVAQRPDGKIVVHKLLSENPDRYEDAPIQGMRDLLGVAAGQPLPAGQIASIKMGTTVATNALLERKGDRTLFITTKGFRDGLRIGYQNRPDIFAHQIILPDILYEQVVEVRERVSATGEVLQVMTPKVEKQLLADLQAAYAQGIRACAIALIHGYRYPDHEKRVAEIARQVGFTQISVSHQVSPLVKWVSRADTTVVDAYLSPILRRYVERIEQALASDHSSGDRTQLLFMQSHGGLTPAKYFQGKDSILSGPAGGIVGAVQTSHQAGFDKIITFDMGGTSTDVAHFKWAGQSSSNPDYERAYESEVAGVRLRSPMMAIHTVAAGGGSVLAFDGTRYQVGPESAGAYPGPACYRNEGPLTVTDCNVMVGKIQPQFFPQAFGSAGNQPLDKGGVQVKFSQLAAEIGAATEGQRRPEQVAEGFLMVAIDNMANAIKKISVQKGYDISGYTLCCFGAAGGQHACRLAESLGMATIFIHPYAGVLSAYGMGLADRRLLKEQSVEQDLSAEMMDRLSAQMKALSDGAIAALKAQGDDDIDRLEVLQKVHLRYAGTDSALSVDFGSFENLQQQFETRYQQQYGITLPDKKLVVSTIAAEAIGKMAVPASVDLDFSVADRLSGEEESAIATVPLFSNDQWHDAPVFEREALVPDTQLVGPVIILEKTGTNIVEPGWIATVNAAGALLLTRQVGELSDSYARPETQIEHQPDPVKLEIFNSLFRAIAEQMGFTLQNTSSSVNIKERLDFSCAIFDAQGQLVANAPHIPVHLGSMGESVKALIAAQREPFRPGDTFISNNPYNGGTHLPDITAITPVFIEETEKPLFFVASRGHHADIGGMTPGSMPPNSTHLNQEGVLLDNVKLVDQGKLQIQCLRDRLSQTAYPARNPDQNIADLQAQIAANHKGTQELHRMVEQFGLTTVQSYMQHVQNNAEQAVRRVIKQLYQQHGETPLTCQVPMDCGATIQVAVTLNASEQQSQKIATIDFTGTSPQQPNNFNAPLAVCKAAVLYVFRTLVDAPIPLNAGCLKPLDIIVPPGCLLNPAYPAAVVAGNVETSQAITDALYGALNVLAASQGTMNNFTFGNEQYQYYETICGGAGAGATFSGTDAVQTHMTNSRLTDPEILEMRFPILLESFAIRPNSGGAGLYAGGNGVIRQMRFREAMTANLLSGRRKVVPFGLEGGHPGLPGHTQVARQQGDIEILAATASVEMQPGDLITISTPGGGGYGKPVG
ncbi:MAG: 5-oxoprolinase [Phormidesmis priestleyi]|uniref:5-oxoprolinase n=1 Tax=Phormidesmis priestleyi TaxID=268141 RepID=A0A2W4WUT9_9CYAN|nr:MAG: 5-oxoprolinase [Phormidesmis priestleyi]